MRYTAGVVILMVVTLAAAGVSVGCRADEPGSVLAGDTVFPDDRVGDVRIMMSDDDWAEMRSDPLAKRYAVADFSLDGEELRNVAVRPKGSSSLQAVADLGIPQFGLTVDFNLLNVARNFRGLRKIDLNTGFKYHLLLRARLASELFAAMGVPAPRTAFAEVWVNGDRLGVYALVEHVDRTFLRRHFDSAAGNLYKPSGAAGPLDWTEADLAEHDRRSAGPMAVNLGGGSIGDLFEAVGQSRRRHGRSGLRALRPHRRRGAEDEREQAGPRRAAAFPRGVERRARLHVSRGHRAGAGRRRGAAVPGGVGRDGAPGPAISARPGTTISTRRTAGSR